MDRDPSSFDVTNIPYGWAKISTAVIAIKRYGIIDPTCVLLGEFIINVVHLLDLKPDVYLLLSHGIVCSMWRYSAIYCICDITEM